MRARSTILEGLGAFVAFSSVAVLVTWPLAPQLGSNVIGDPATDVGGTVALLWTLGQEGGYHIFGATTHTLTGAPLGWEQGNAINVQWLLYYYPAYLMSLVWGEIASYNLTILSGLVLSSVAMYALARRLGCTPLAAGWAGLVYMIFPWHIWRVNAGHASLVHIEVFPLLFLALHAWTRQPSGKRAALVGLATAAAWLASGYWGVMAVIGAVAFALAASAVRARREEFSLAASQFGLLVLGTLAGTLAVGLASIPGRAEGGITIPRTLGELSVLAARPAEFVVPAADNPILGSATESIRPGLHGSSPAETTLYLGWLTIALALVCIGFVLWRRRTLSTPVLATAGGLVAALLAGLAFAAPSPVGVGGGRLFTWTPSWFLFQVLPEVRIPSRFVALVSTALIPLAALGLQFTSQWVRRRFATSTAGSSLAVATAAAAIGLSIVELFPNVWDQTRADRLPPIYQAVERTPHGVLVEYPLDEGSDYRFWQRLHGRPLLNGAKVGTEADDLGRLLVDPAGPGTSETLSALGVTAIVTHADALDYAENVPDVPNAHWGDGYELVERFPDGSSVWRVVAPPAPAVAILRSPAFGGPTRPRNGFIGYPLQLGSGEIWLYSTKASVARLAFEVDVPEKPGAVLRIAGATRAITFPVTGRAPVSLVVDVPRGQSRLTLTVDSEGAQRIELSAPRLTRTPDRPALRPVSISPDIRF